MKLLILWTHTYILQLELCQENNIYVEALVGSFNSVFHVCIQYFARWLKTLRNALEQPTPWFNYTLLKPKCSKIRLTWEAKLFTLLCIIWSFNIISYTIFVNIRLSNSITFNQYLITLIILCFVMGTEQVHHERNNV